MSGSFVVLAVLREEVDALRNIVPNELVDDAPKALAPCYRLKIAECQGFLVQVAGAGRVRAAVATTHAIHHWQPSLLVMVGTAGGFRHRGIALGDLIVATEILDYESQRLGGDEVDVRWKNFYPTSSLVEIARLVAINAGGRVHFEPILSGDKVIASKHAIRHLLREHGEAVGVEMEGAGLAFAAGDVPFLVVRGVADYADNAKREDARLWGERACRAAAEFTVNFITAWRNGTA